MEGDGLGHGSCGGHNNSQEIHECRNEWLGEAWQAEDSEAEHTRLQKALMEMVCDVVD